MDDSNFDILSSEIIRNLFCIEFEGAYQDDFIFDVPFTLHQAISAILKSNGLESLSDEFDKAAETKDYKIGCTSTPDGSCFAFAQYKKDANSILIFMSLVITPEVSPTDQPRITITSHSILAGIEDEDEGELYFKPFAILCRAVVDDDGKEMLIEPSSNEDFYASLCYMQYSMATCFLGSPLEVLRNQAWLDPEVSKRAYQEFVKMIGATTLIKVLEDHQERLEIAEELLEKLEELEDDPSALDGYKPPILN